MKWLIALLLTCSSVLGQGFGSFTYDQPFLASGKRSTTLLNGLFEYWSLNVSNNNSWAGSLGVTNLFTPAGNPFCPTNFPNGINLGAAGFTANAAQILLSGHTNFNSVNREFTISLWFKGYSEANNHTLISRWDSTVSHQVWKIMWNGTFLTFEASDTNNLSFSRNLASANSGISNSWSHLSFGWRSNGIFWSNLNGSGKLTNSVGVAQYVYPLKNTLAVNWGLGNWGDGSKAWLGPIDEVGYWNRELTDAECSDLYYSGMGWFYPFDPR